MEQASVIPMFWLIAVGALILMAVGLALRNSSVAKNGGVAAAALAVGVLALGWLMARGEAPGFARGAPYPHEYAQAQPDIVKSWGLVLILGAVVTAVVFAIRGASSPARAAMTAGGIAIGLLALILVGYTSVHVDQPSAVVMVDESLVPPTQIPLDADAHSKPAPRKSPSGKSKKSRNSSRSKPPLVEPTPSRAPAGAQGAASTDTRPRAPEPGDEAPIASLEKTPDPVAPVSPPSDPREEHAHDQGHDHEHGLPTGAVAGTADATSIDLGQAKSKDRPTWVDSTGEFAADGTYYAIVHTNPSLNVRDATRQIEPLMRREAQEFVDLIMPRTRYTRFNNLLPWQAIAQQAEQDRYVEKAHSRFAGTDTYVVHVRMAFTPQLQQQIESMMRNLLRYQRTWLLVVVAGFVLLVIGVVFGYLMLDTATKGYYTWRLRLLSVAIVLLAFAGLCGIIEELDLDEVFDTFDWQPVAQAPSGRLR